MMIRVTQPTSLGVPMVVAHWLRDIADIMSHTFVSISVKLIIIDNRRGKLCSYLEGGNYGVNEQDEDADKNNRVGSCEKGVGEEGADQQEGKAHLDCICFLFAFVFHLYLYLYNNTLT